MKRPAVFFDRDNTLIVSDGYLGDPEAVVLVDGAAELVARVRRLGYAAVTFSNQSGVARGLFTEEDVHRVNSRLDEMLLDHQAGAVIDRHEFCPHHPEAAIPRYRQASEFRKPSPGMIYQAARQLGLDLGRSWVVGDAPRDIEAGRAAGCRTILFKDPGLPPSEAAREPSPVEPDFVAASLKEVAELIENNPPAEEPAETGPVAAEPGAAHDAAPQDDAVGPAPGEEPAETGPVAAEQGGAHEAASQDDAAEPAPVVEVAASEPLAATDLSPDNEHHGTAGDAALPEVEPSQEQASPAIPPNLAAAVVEEPVAVEQDQVAHADVPAPAATAAEEPEPTEHEQTPAAPVEAAIAEESAAAPDPGPSAEEEDMDDTATGPASSGGGEPDGAVRRRSPPAVILAAKAAREAARNSAPDAPPEVLREVARNAAREAAMGVTRDYSATAPAAAPADAAPDDTPDDAPLERTRPMPQERVVEPAGESPRYTEPGAQAYQPTASDRTDEPGVVPSANLQRLETIAEQILLELRSRHDPGNDFSVSKLMAGITMVISLALLVYAYLYKDNTPVLNSVLLLGLMLQAITISLLLMGRQK